MEDCIHIGDGWLLKMKWTQKWVPKVQLMCFKYMKTSILALENYLPKNSINELYFPYDALGAPVLQFQPIFYSFLEKREN